MEETRIGLVEKRLAELEKRVSDFEKILSPKRTASLTASSGATGAVYGLISDHFLDEPKLATEVLNELRRLGHYHSLQTVDEVLRRLNKAKVLTRIGKRGEWRYAVRR